MATKAKKKEKLSRLTKELLETAYDMRKSGLMTKGAHDKVTMRHLGTADIPASVMATISARDIKAIRAHAKLSQAVFARYLNVSAGYVSKLERGEETPLGPTLVLLNAIRRKGFEAILL
jgi:putative transcriptional regulator